ncbi:MAG: hypothetical protein AAGB04_31850, partial [Pseudomonadota bacterium]
LTLDMTVHISPISEIPEIHVGDAYLWTSGRLTQFPGKWLMSGLWYDESSLIWLSGFELRRLQHRVKRRRVAGPSVDEFAHLSQAIF